MSRDSPEIMLQETVRGLEGAPPASCSILRAAQLAPLSICKTPGGSTSPRTPKGICIRVRQDSSSVFCQLLSPPAAAAAALTSQKPGGRASFLRGISSAGKGRAPLLLERRKLPSSAEEEEGGSPKPRSAGFLQKEKVRGGRSDFLF